MHRYLRSPVWSFTCRSLLRLCLNNLAHQLHLYGIWSPWLCDIKRNEYTYRYHSWLFRFICIYRSFLLKVNRYNSMDRLIILREYHLSIYKVFIRQIEVFENYGRLRREEILWKFRKIYLWKINSAKFSKRKLSLRFPFEKIRFLKNFRSLSNSSYISFVSVKNLIDVAIQTSWRRRRSLRPSVRIVSSKKPTARKSYVPRLLRWTKSDSEEREKKGEHKKSCTKRMTRPVRDHIGHTDLPGWQPPEGIPRRGTFLPRRSSYSSNRWKSPLSLILDHVARFNPTEW